MNDWADAAASKLKAQRQNQTLKDAAFVEKQRIKKARGPALWQEVRKAVKENCEALNLQMGRTVLTFDVVPNTGLSVRADLGGTHRWLKAAFDDEQGTLEYNTETHSDKWELMVTDDGGVAFAWGIAIQTPPAKIATQMLNSLLELTF